MAGTPVVFAAGASGVWRIERQVTIRGQGLPAAPRLDRIEEPAAPPEAALWSLRGITSNARYTSASERAHLRAAEAPLGRPEADRAALIPITKSVEWWELAQDERRAILEERSRHIATGLEYLPAIARRLYHARDLGEPFDFLTWFEFAEADAPAFDELVGRLRETPEWQFVVREVDLRLSRP